MNKLKNMRFQVNYEIEESKEDVRFKKVKIYVAHTKWNLNSSFFSKELLETMAKNSIANIPITAFVKMVDENKDFAGHEEIVVINDDGVELKYLGVPIGFIPETNNYSFEIKDEKEWLVVEGIVWNKFETSEILGELKSQSMELLLDDLEGSFEENYEEGTGWVMKNATFDALCALGDNHTPAMTGSIIETLSSNFSKDNKEKLFINEMKDMLNEYTSFIEGGENVKKDKNKFELNNEQIEDILYQTISKKYDSVYGLRLNGKKVFFKANWEERVILIGVEYEFNKLEAVINWESKGIYVLQPILVEDVQFEYSIINEVEAIKDEHYSKEITELKASHVLELETMTSDNDSKFEVLQTETNELKKFKSDVLESQIKEYVQSVENLSADEKSVLIETIDTFTMETVKDEVAKIIGRNSIQFTVDKKVDDVKDKINDMGFDNEFEGKSYANLIKQ